MTHATSMNAAASSCAVGTLDIAMRENITKGEMTGTKLQTTTYGAYGFVNATIATINAMITGRKSGPLTAPRSSVRFTSEPAPAKITAICKKPRTKKARNPIAVAGGRAVRGAAPAL